MHTEEYRKAVADAMAARDAAVAKVGEDEDARKAAITAFDTWNAEARAKREASMAAPATPAQEDE